VLELRDWAPGKTEVPLAAELRSLEDVERDHILLALNRTDWRVSGPRGAARILGIKPTTLESRMARLGIRRIKQ
jgi:transcriptional regulator with GAF, ATPase, and Fis domain